MLSILFIIGKHSKVNQRTLAERLVLDQSTISRDLKRLQQRNFIVNRRGADTRTKEWSLTMEGVLFLEKISPIWEGIQQEVSNLLGEFNIQQIDGITRAIHELQRKAI